MYRCAIVAVGLLLALGTLSAQANWRWMRDSAASEFTDADWEILRSEALRVLDEVESGVRVNWENQATGNSGAIKALMTFEHQGKTCRRVAFLNVSSKGRRGQANYNLCREDDGRWGFVSDSEVAG